MTRRSIILVFSLFTLITIGMFIFASLLIGEQDGSPYDNISNEASPIFRSLEPLNI